MKNQLYSISFFLFYLLWITAVSCKLAGIITLSWWVILFPIWAPFALGALIISGALLFLMVALMGVMVKEYKP